jgi:hypothetical protein
VKARLVRKGIVAYSTVRIAAGAGVVAASLLIAGPNPAAAVADRHGSGHSNDDFRQNGSSGQGGTIRQGASNLVKDVVSGIGSIAGIDRNSKPNLDPPKMDLGTAGSDTPQLFMAESLAPEGQPAMRSAAVAEAPVGDNLTVAALPGGGSGYAGQPAAAFRSPHVTIGNGRAPGTRVARPPSEAVLNHDGLVAPEAVPAVPAAIEINIPPLPPPLPPVERIGPAELVVGEYGTGTTDTVTDPLAGVAGLILIPAIGAVLGYRQARAAQSLRESLRTSR